MELRLLGKLLCQLKWLEKNYLLKEAVWLIFYKKSSPTPNLSWSEAVDEALCFGWIDSLIRRIDDERYMQKYTPRKPKSTWSVHNVRRIEKMLAAGKMNAKGMELYDYARKNDLLPDIHETNSPDKIFPEAPEFFLQAL